MTEISTQVHFDDGDAISEFVWINTEFSGCIWTDGENCGWSYRRGNAAGQWHCDAYKFSDRKSAILGLELAVEEERLRH